jgi:type VI secretion system protein ImpB
MPKEGSVAPKERVNIVYRPATGDAQAEVELPLKLLMLGDFTNRTDSTPLGERRRTSIDKDNFNDVMGQHKLGLTINVPDRLTGKEGQELALDLRLDTLKDFTPGEIAKRVPELAKLLELRDALGSLKRPLNEEAVFRKKIEDYLKDPAQRDKLLKQLESGDEGGPSPS